jgi:hypothetical protein
MNVIFLDIDGVLNTPGSCPPYNDVLERPWIGIEPLFVERLNELTRTVGAAIVLSSSWRLWLPRHAHPIEPTLRKAGITAPFLGCTGRKGNRADGKRGEEVADWLTEHPEVQSWVVLDDTDDFDNLPSHRVLITNEVLGLTWKDVAQAVAILEGRFEDAWPGEYAP